MVMVWLEVGQGEVRGACAPPPHPNSPHLDPPPPSRPPPLPRSSLNPHSNAPPPPPPQGGLQPTSTLTGGGVAYKSEETAPPWGTACARGKRGGGKKKGARAGMGQKSGVAEGESGKGTGTRPKQHRGPSPTTSSPWPGPTIEAYLVGRCLSANIQYCIHYKLVTSHGLVRLRRRRSKEVTERWWDKVTIGEAD